jgi:hypothetical protein
MKPEKHLLIHDLLEGHGQDTRRQATLLAGGRILRRKRWRRVAIRCLAVAAVIAGATFTLQRGIVRQPVALTAAPKSAVHVHYLSDDELLGLFPDTPVGWAAVGAKKRLIFPRPGDEARFITRL